MDASEQKHKTADAQLHEQEPPWYLRRNHLSSELGPDRGARRARPQQITTQTE